MNVIVGWIAMDGEDWSETDYSGGRRRVQSEKEEPHASHRIAHCTWVEGKVPYLSPSFGRSSLLYLPCLTQKIITSDVW